MTLTPSLPALRVASPTPSQGTPLAAWQSQFRGGLSVRQLRCITGNALCSMLHS